MKKLLQLFVMISLIIAQATAQTSNAYATVRWQSMTAWTPLDMQNTVHDNLITQIHAGLEFNWQRSPDCDSYGNIKGKPQMMVSNSDPGITAQNVWVTVRGIDCNGKSRIDICTPGTIGPYEHKSQVGNLTHNFKEIEEVIKCSFSYYVGKDLYTVSYSKETHLTKFLVNGKSIAAFEEGVKKKKEDELNKQMGKIKAADADLKNRMKGYDINNESDADKRNKYLKPKSGTDPGLGSGVRGDNNSPANKPEVLAVSAENYQQRQAEENQRRQREAQIAEQASREAEQKRTQEESDRQSKILADNASNAQTAATKSMYLQQARLKGMQGGSKQQQEEIEEEIKKNNNASNDAFANAANSLLDLLTTKKTKVHKDTYEEKKKKIEDEVKKDAEKRGDANNSLNEYRINQEIEVARVAQANKKLADQKAANIALEKSLSLLNKEAPDFSINEINGNPIQLSSLKGKKIILIFWNSSNDKSINEFKAISENSTLLAAKGCVVVGIGLEFSKYQWSNAIAENNLQGIQVCEFGGKETDTSLAYGVTETPTLFLIDNTGKVRQQGHTFNDIKSKIF